MPKVTFVDSAGTARTVEGRNGQTLQELAEKNNIPGIDADCGGACSCATCHVYVAEEWLEKVGKPTGMEQSMLDFAENVTANSRLSCQIRLSEPLDGITVTTPESQH
jgi:2Fe-2S ferredoxin